MDILKSLEEQFPSSLPPPCIKVKFFGTLSNYIPCYSGRKVSINVRRGYIFRDWPYGLHPTDLIAFVQKEFIGESEPTTRFCHTTYSRGLIGRYQVYESVNEDQVVNREIHYLDLCLLGYEDFYKSCTSWGGTWGDSRTRYPLSKLRISWEGERKIKKALLKDTV